VARQVAPHQQLAFPIEPIVELPGAERVNVRPAAMVRHLSLEARRSRRMGCAVLELFRLDPDEDLMGNAVRIPDHQSDRLVLSDLDVIGRREAHPVDRQLHDPRSRGPTGRACIRAGPAGDEEERQGGQERRP
jgi:hypothetical protein